MAPHIFFKELVPALLATSKRTQGICRITLFGRTRYDWTIDLARGTVQRDARYRIVDLDLEMEEQDFTALLAGRLDWDRAISAGRIRYLGELAVLVRLAELFNAVH
jgi:hypothetical protein